MSARAARRLAWSLWAVSMALVAGLLTFAALNRHADVAGARDRGLYLALTPILLVLPTMGALIASRRPRHPIGWILAGAGALFALAVFAEGYGVHALYTESGGLPAGEVAAAVSAFMFIPPLLTTPALLFLLFPDGRLPGPRRRPAVWLAVISAAAAMVHIGLFSDRLDTPFDGVANPLSVGAPGLVAEAASVGWTGMLAAVVVAAAAMIVRLRRSRGEQRQQLKWISAAAVLFAITTSISVIGFVSPILIALTFPLIPIAAGVAILRHRIYDIDLVVNRALVYGALTALLAGAYLASVLLLGQALGPITRESDLAIALSTLGVAALFRPARWRVQALVDRRFYRRKYDAERTLERFGARLRVETDLEAMRAELTGLVRETMQPAHVSLWLRERTP